MSICPWCGQQSQSDSNCDWCKRPMAGKIGPPPGARSDLDFLKDESEGDKFGMVKIGAIAACAIAIGIVLYFVFAKPSTDTVAEAGSPQDVPPPQATSTNVPGARLVANQPQFQSHPNNYWIDVWNGGLNSNARGSGSWTNSQPATRSSANVAVNFPLNSPVKLENVEMTMISLPGETKRIAGRADIVNASDKNVIDYRVELVWGPNEYTMMPLQGTDKSLHQVYQRALRPGKKMAVQLVSLKIKNRPDGAPNAVRLTAWLDGSPGTALDEYQLQFGR